MIYNFSTQLAEKEGQPIQYKGKILVLGKWVEVEENDLIEITLEKTDSKYPQAINIKANKRVEIEHEGARTDNGLNLWTTNFPGKTLIKIVKVLDKNNNKIFISNAWEEENGLIQKWVRGAAIHITEIENGWRFYCNDGDLDDDFDDLIFTVIKIT